MNGVQSVTVQPDATGHFEATLPTPERLVVWKHDCIKHGMATAEGEGPCDPPCEDPWQVDAPWPLKGDSFPTFREAVAYADDLRHGREK